ncbi:MAG: DMT family transporter [Treponema sp.]|nr:DMT family transporter [Candidatus Treponema equi]
MKQDNLGRGIAWIILSSFGFAMMGALVRAAGDIHFMQKALFRNSIAFIIAFTTLMVKARNDRSILAVPRAAWKYLFLRSFTGSFGIFGNFYAIGHMNISDAAMLNKMSPFASVFLSIFILGDRPTLFSAGALITAFCGALFVIKPSFNFTEFLPALAGFLGGLGAGFAYAFVRKMHSKYDVASEVIITFFSLFSVIIALPFFFIYYAPMSCTQLFLLIGAGASAAVGQFGVTNAYFNAPSSKISLYEYTNVIFSAILGFMMFQQIPDIYSFIGYGIIISAATLMFFYNKRKMEKN